MTTAARDHFRINREEYRKKRPEFQLKHLDEKCIFSNYFSFPVFPVSCPEFPSVEQSDVSENMNSPSGTEDKHEKEK